MINLFLAATLIGMSTVAQMPMQQLPPIQQPTPTHQQTPTIPGSAPIKGAPHGPQKAKYSPQGQPRLEGEMQVTAIYTSPGVATLQNGEWVGNENLYNISKDLAIVVEIIAPPNIAIPITKEMIREAVIPILRQAGLQPQMTILNSPLPFFHVLIMINPIDKGYVAYCAGRLFEKVSLSRIQLAPSYSWQAITWEKQELLLFGTEQLKGQVISTVESIAKAFTERYQSYQNKK
jgi:hypothetical protein